MDACSLLLGHP
jgi:hypothetical protein